MGREVFHRYGYRILLGLLPVALTVWLFGGLTPLSTHQLPYFYAISSDQSQQVWFLSWPAHALAHGLNPFVSGAINAPHGVNLMSNTAMVLLGIVFAPVTWVLGPLATYLTVCELGIVLSAWSLTWVMRRVGIGRTGSLLGGLVFGFNPLAVAAVTVHPYLAFKPFFPLVAYWLYRIIVTPVPRWRDGLYLGASFAGVFLVMQEAAGASLYVSLMCLVIAALVWRRHLSLEWILERLRILLVGVATTFVIVAYPLWVMFAGPWHVVGSPHEFLGDFHADALAFVAAPGTFNGSLLGMSGVVNSLRITPWENGAYIGPLFVALALGLWWYRRSRFAWWLAASGVAVASLVLGSHLYVAGHRTSIPLPMDILQHLPLGSSVIPARFMSFLWLLIALALGIVVGAIVKPRPAERIFTVPVRATLAGSVAIGLFFISPSAMNGRWTPPHQPALTSSAFAQLVPEGSVVLTYPYASALNSNAMMDLALSANRYELIGGHAMVPSPGTGKSQAIEPLAPVGVFNTFLHAQFTPSELAFVQLALNGNVGPADDSVQFQKDIKVFASRYRLTDVVGEAIGPTWGFVRTELTSSFGAPHRVGRLWVWVIRPSAIHNHG